MRILPFNYKILTDRGPLLGTAIVTLMAADWDRKIAAETSTRLSSVFDALRSKTDKHL